MSGKKSRDKGMAGEIEARDILRTAWPECERDLEQTRGEDNGRDLINTEPWVFQVKRHKKITQGIILDGLVEAMIVALAEDKLPAVIYRGDREDWRITAHANDFLYFIGETHWLWPTNPRMTMDLWDFVWMVKEVLQYGKATQHTDP